MSHNLMVSFEIRDWVRQGPLIAAAIEELGRAVRVFGSTWFVSSSVGAVEAASRVSGVMNTDDGLLVADIKENTVALINVDDAAYQCMKRVWSEQAAIEAVLDAVSSAH